MKALPFLLASLLITFFVNAQQDTLSSHVFNLAKLSTAKDSSRDRIQFMDGSTSVLANIEAHLTTLAPGKAAHPPHTHTNQEELIIVKNGLFKVTIAGQTKLLSAGGIALALP